MLTPVYAREADLCLEPNVRRAHAKLNSRTKVAACDYALLFEAMVH